jgi:hypothetical protein
VVTQCEINSGTGERCDVPASGWCRTCDRAICEHHRRAGGRASAAFVQCTSCAGRAVPDEVVVDADFHAALDDITHSVRALRVSNCARTEFAHKYAVRRSWWRPWTLRSHRVYSIRYWPVGTFTWVQSCPGGFGEHELVSLGTGEYETVVNERGQITRRDDQEIVSGRAVLAQLVSAPAATITIAAALREHLNSSA